MRSSTQKTRITRSTNKIKDLTLFAILGAVMFASQIAMSGLPNIHLIGLFTASFTLTYKSRALIPIYVYVMIYGALYGFSSWWLPYLYIWLPLWGMFMLLGKISGKLKLSRKTLIPISMILCGLHGLSFGTLYAPVQALIFGFSFKSMLAWIAAGLPFDVVHAISNLCAGVLIVPLSELLRKLEKKEKINA